MPLFELPVVDAVEEQLDLAEMILGAILVAGTRPAEEPADADARRDVVLAERIDGHRFFERSVGKEDAEVGTHADEPRVGGLRVRGTGNQHGKESCETEQSSE